MKQKFDINNFSKHLFWDIDRTKLCLDKDNEFIIQRTLEYGLINDWEIIYNYYGIEKISKTVMNLKYLDKKSITFISLLSKIPKEKFLSYTTKQSTPKHWEF